MTLSPGQKVQPKRSMRISPGGFSAACNSIFSDRAPSPPRFIGQSTWISRTIEPKTLRDTLAHDGHHLAHPIFGIDRLDEIEITVLGGGKLRHQTLVDTVGIRDDAAC